MRKYFLKRASAKGFEVDNFDRSTGVECPREECNLIVVYNGNYFCECGWAALDWPWDKFEPDEQRYMDKLYEGLLK